MLAFVNCGGTDHGVLRSPTFLREGPPPQQSPPTRYILFGDQQAWAKLCGRRYSFGRPHLSSCSLQYLWHGSNRRHSIYVRQVSCAFGSERGLPKMLDIFCSAPYVRGQRTHVCQLIFASDHSQLLTMITMLQCVKRPVSQSLQDRVLM